jgi:beta-N-acetylhexosaminidase
LSGEIDIKGKLPVSIPGTKYHIGMGEELNKSISTKLTYSLSDNIKFNGVDNLIINSIREGKISNVRLSIGLNGQIIYQKTFGAVVSSSEDKLSQRNQFNIGTLTEPVALSTAVMLLIDDGFLSIDDRVYYYLPGFEVNNKKNITIRNLLLHNSGLGQNIDSLNTSWSREKLIDAINNIELKYKINETEVYSILNNLILQLIIENISGETLRDFLQNRLLNPVGMSYTYLNESQEDNGNDSLLIHKNFRYGSFLSSGNVIKKIMGGAAGFDGMISTVEDLSIFAQLMIQKGYYNGEQFISASIINEFVKPNLPESYAGLGWQTYISGINISNNLSKTSYGYNSNNGSSLWIDPDNKMFIIFLTDSDIKNTKSLIVEIQSEVMKNINNK